MATPGTFSIHTLGCKLNYAESSTLARQLEQAGWQQSPKDGQADLYLLNTCSVTEFADKKCRQAVRKFKRDNPSANIVVTGCYAQLKPEEISEIQGVDLVLGAAEKFNLLRYVENLQLGQPLDAIVRGEIGSHQEFHASYSAGDRTRAFLKVQDGCDYKCSFCTIPKARGLSRSAAIDQVLTQANELVEQGIQEIVLTGVNIGDFGINPMTKKREESFLDLIRALDSVDVPRIRISSIEPNLCHDGIIEFVAGSKRFMPHFHMPLQSGSNQMLQLMRRRYRKELYAERVKRIKEVMPHACIGVDVIVGFHGETDAYFDETYSFLHELDVSYLHVFTYSERSDTHAEQMSGRIPMEVRKNRNKHLRLLSNKKRHYFYSEHVGTSRPVLFEKTEMVISGMNMRTGYTDNYIKVNCTESATARNTIHMVHLDEIDQDAHVRGEIVHAGLQVS